MQILIKFASRSRPTQFFAGIDNILKNATTPVKILATLDLDDSSMNNDEVKSWVASLPQVTALYGCSADKIDAINRDMDKAGHWDILINFSDDMHFTEKGFDQIIIDDFNANFPDLDGVIHYPDGYVNERLMTMSIIGRKYFDRFGYIYHPDYVSLWCDNEAQDVAKKLGKYKYIPKHIFRHEHPLNGGANKMDDLYRENEKYFQQDKKTYEKRLAMNFGL